MTIIEKSGARRLSKEVTRQEVKKRFSFSFKKTGWGGKKKPHEEVSTAPRERFMSQDFNEPDFVDLELEITDTLKKIHEEDSLT